MVVIGVVVGVGVMVGEIGVLGCMICGGCRIVWLLWFLGVGGMMDGVGDGVIGVFVVDWGVWCCVCLMDGFGCVGRLKCGVFGIVIDGFFGCVSVEGWVVLCILGLMLMIFCMWVRLLLLFLRFFVGG